jgi:hypothetical protein
MDDETKSRTEINKTKLEDISSQSEKLINLVLHSKETIDSNDRSLRSKNKIIIFLVVTLLLLICYLIFPSLKNFLFVIIIL